MKTDIFFSVIIPLYNKENTIERTIDSVLNQTFKNFELIIVNDGSTDFSFNKIKKYNDSRIKIIDQKNKGVSFSRNIGIKESKANWVTFLDADDYWELFFLENFYMCIKKNKDIGFIFSSYFFDEEPRIIKRLKEPTEVKHYYNQIRKFGVSPNSSSVAVNKKCFDEIGFFEEDIKIGEDTDMWYRLMWSCKTVYLPKLLSHVSLGSSNWIDYEKYPSFWFFRFNQWEKEERLSMQKNKEYELLYNRQLLKYLLFGMGLFRKSSINVQKPYYNISTIFRVVKFIFLDFRFVRSLLFHKLKQLYV